MNQTLYNLIGYLLLPIMLLRFFFKGLTTPAYGKRIGERLGFVDIIPEGIIWVHCVSVGEFRAATVLIDALIKQYPQYKILVTSTTPTGSQAIRDTYQDKVLHYYFPFDLPLIVNRYVKKINPKICILLETEIWPSLYHTLHKNNIPSLLVNARLSPRSLEKYQKFAPKLAQQTLNKLNVIATQNHNSAQRFITLGASKDKVIMAGNIKFELNPTTNQAISKQLNALTDKRKVVVFASTHKGEEAQIIEAYGKQKNKIDALLVIIPRHPERFNEVYKLAQKHKINIIKRSDNQICDHCDILLGDSMGEMMNYFDIANVVFMGGSLVKTGGHNMLEPAALAKPIIFGTYVFNFAEISTDLLNQNAAIQVQNADELFVEITRLLTHDNTAESLGNNAQQYLQSKQGATDKLMQKITSLLPQ
ncbi:3-deoxy-D-manno-octulosonic acid transferase (EC 2.4.99.12)(EC 2.4.99.13) [uncultured Gammaproteobacteria bacterium]|jgi:3-deoxy-D-manno-octulosonic-acid transferase|nr:3-deoxy-D-manno-octulosonic acid transferase (EC 2.4.99.12)(EC 2.4.99.13) [uncultured Gammaproteobacteria bacterium]